MKRILFIFILIIITTFSYSQTKAYFKITGKVRDFNTYQFLHYCNVKLVSSTGIALEVKTNKKGDYIFDSLSIENKHICIEVTKKGYFNNSKSKKTILFNQIPKDTIIDFFITPIPRSGTFFPEIYFKYNSVMPDSNNWEDIYYIVKMTHGFYHQKLVIIGYKDSIETIDKRKERAEFVKNYLIKNGVDSNKLTISLSDKPNIGKYIEPKIDEETGEITYYDITESFIQCNPKEKQESLRQLNRCVTFSITSDE